ncbi:MAG: hypothetical protein KAS97_01715 [Candidatus Aminicenantes bacterium]|nr:hypothetical protein [Candidatus Aminicenantes bacterium]
MKAFRMVTDKFNKEKKIISLFREKGALSVELAKDLRNIGDVNRSVFNKLYGKGVLARGGGETFFLNEQALMKYRMDRVKWAMILMFTILAILILISRS